MALNLSRSTRVFVTSAATTGTEVLANTWEVLVLDGYSFSQDANATTITLNEAGATPTRGQQVFTDSLNPVDLSFTTYMRPFVDTSDSSNIKAGELILWEALIGAGSGTVAAPLRNAAADTTSLKVSLEDSDVHELLKLKIYFNLENTTYVCDDVQINSAEIDFAIDGIAQITWTGQATAINENGTVHTDIGTWVAETDYNSSPSTADFIKNKLSTVTLQDNLTTADAATVSAEWNVPNSPLVTTSTTAYLASTSTARTFDLTVDGGTVQNISYVPDNDMDSNTYGELIETLNRECLDCYWELDEDGLGMTCRSLTSGANSTILINNEGATTASAFSDVTNGLTNNTSIGTEAVNGSGAIGTLYNVAITGGTLTIDNGITFLTPEELANVNTPIGSFSGARAVSGSLTAYLRTGAGDTAALLADLVADTSVVTQDFNVTINVGGVTASTSRTQVNMPHCHITVPSISVEDVISTEIQFTALGQSLEAKDELYIEYFADPAKTG